MVVSAQKLHFQLPDKYSGDVSRCINNRTVFQSSYVFSPQFLAELQKMFCGTLRLRGTLFEEQCLTRYRTSIINLLSSICISTRINKVGSNTGRDKHFFYPPERPHRLWSPAILIFN
jgi:hypothetical protein